MKKFYWTMMVTAMMALLFTGCGKKGDQGETLASSEAVGDETAASKQYPDEAYLDNLNVEDYVELGDYKGIEVGVVEPHVSDSDVEDYIADVRSNHMVNEEVTGRAAESGDVVSIDFVGKKDGVAFDRGSGEDLELTIGAGGYVEGFENGIIGMKPGETKDVPVTFPENYQNNPDMSGADVVFTMTLNGIYKKVLPEFDDAFVKSLAIEGVENTAQYREYAYNLLLERDQSRFDIEVENAVISKATENATFKADAEALAERYYDRLVTNLSWDAAMYSIDLNTYMMLFYNMDEETYTKEMKASGEEAARQVLVLQAIAQQEGLTVTDAEVEADIIKSAADYGYESADAYKEAMGDEVKGYREMLMTDKVSAYLVENAKVTRVKPENNEPESNAADEDSADSGSEPTDSQPESTVEDGETESAGTESSEEE